MMMMISPVATILLLIGSATCVLAHNITDAISVSNQTDSSFSESQGRSAAILSDLPRQGRIMNDDKISIKGFIPIVGLGEDSVKEKMKDANMNNYLKTMASISAANGDSSDLVNLPQHVAQPEDQRFLGALQGLLGNSMKKSGFGMMRPSQGITRKSDCVCVPFYMCKNGFISNSGVDGSSGGIPSMTDLNALYQANMYEQRRGEMQVAESQSVPHQQYNPTTEAYLQIDERSNDKMNDSFTEEILGRMLGGKSMSDGCGLLRTCCQRAGGGIPSELLQGFGGQNYGQMIPEHSGIYKPAQQQHYYKPNTYTKPNGYFNPSGRPLPPQPHPYRPYRPPKLVNAPSYLEPSVEAPLPLPIRNELPQYPPNVADFAYDKCGLRQAVGINGRVQNLNYHQSSTEFGEFPWQVAILKKIGPSDNLYVCGGVLISSNFILTAAHCIKKFQANDLKVRLGEWDVHREDEFYPYVEKNVDDILLHPHFSSRNLANDVAVLRIESEIDFNQNPHISPICMAEPFESFAGHRCYVSGWGKNAFGHKGEYQSVLMKVDLPVLDTRVCEGMLKRTRLGRAFRLDRSMICAGGEPGKDACEGDGGSGLLCEMNGIWKVAGLVSWGLGCGQAAVPGVYTNIAQMKPWIDKVVFPYYAGVLQAKSTEKNFNELISERSLDGAPLAANSTNTTTETTTIKSAA